MGDFENARNLLEFSFESVASAMPASTLLRLARRAAAFNTCMGLTGRLRLDGRRFVQTVEGPADVVLPLAGVILADPRHGAIRVTAFGAIVARRFDDWKDEGFAGLAGTAAGGNLHVMPARIERRRPASAAILGIGAASRLSPLPDA
jgi:hypothetical protein